MNTKRPVLNWEQQALAEMVIKRNERMIALFAKGPPCSDPICKERDCIVARMEREA
jgi:hypothetical protein